jgi:hypothetical protein
MNNKIAQGREQEYVIGKIRSVLIKFIKNFQNNPFQYFYEEDIRASLYVLLKSEINIMRNFPTKIYSEGLGRDLINTSIVKSEYPSFSRFDIAILRCSEETDYYNQPVDIAIELKLGSHKIFSDQTAGFKSDINKLKKYKNNHTNENFTGLAIYFCQTDIEGAEIDEWYKDLSKKFELVEINQLLFETNKVYAIIVPTNLSCQIYILQV